MGNSTLAKIKDCSESDAWAIVYYIYQLGLGLGSFRNHEEFQDAYNALVDRLGYQEKAEKVLKAVIEKRVQSKKLKRFSQVPEHYNNPFDYRGRLPENFEEDSDIYDACGNWDTCSLRNIDICRALFSGPEEDFSWIVGLTFFTKDSLFDAVLPEGKTLRLSKTFSIPSNVKKTMEDLSSVKYIKDLLCLSDDEAKLLVAVYRIHYYKELMNVVCELYRNEDFSKIDVYAKTLGWTPKTVRLHLKQDQKLYAFGFINSDGDLDEDAVDCISEKDMRFYFSDIIKSEKNTKTHTLDSFSVSKDKASLALQFLKSEGPCNILLYGAPGSGKTEFARTLLKESGLKMQVYKNELEVSSKDEEGCDQKAISRLNCYLSLKKEDSVLVVDEAENVLKTQSSFFGMKFSLPQKGIVNKMLESSENKVIWILNYTDELDESTLRRFNFSIKFHEMPKNTLRSIAEEKFKNLHISGTLKSELLDLCTQYHVTGASVDNVVRAVKTRNSAEFDETKVISDVRNVLEANSSLVFGKKKMRDHVNPAYDLSILNTSIPAPEVVEMIENAVAAANENSNNPEENGIRMLFYGLSGTGKTELARYISEKLGKKLLLKRTSDILNKYVGENERHIKEAFEEAEETDSILLFDEADSFFSDREQASTGWERTLVNEFLTQMEEFSGILICTTNLRKIMDPAMQRRFHILTEFKPLKESGIKRLLGKYFSKEQFSEEDVARLSKYDSVTPGDFGTLNSKIRFVSKSKINPSFIIDEMIKIQQEKNRNGNSKIGFGA